MKVVSSFQNIQQLRGDEARHTVEPEARRFNLYHAEVIHFMVVCLLNPFGDNTLYLPN